jgi:carbon monoxide dehydrogenase subunit G
VADQTSGDTEIAAAPPEIMDVINDYEAYPEWATGVMKAEVKKRDARGRPVEVAFEVSQMGVSARYTLVYAYKARHGGLSWTTKSASGAVKDIAGEYVLEISGDHTKVTYRTAIETAIPMMGFVKRQAEKAIIGIALGGLKKRVERG